MMMLKQPGVILLPGVVLHMKIIEVEDQVILERWDFAVKDKLQAAVIVRG